MHPKYWKFPGAAYREQATDGTTGSVGGSLDTNSAASAFESRLSDEPEPSAAASPSNDAVGEQETAEQAAERLAREEAGAADPDATAATEPEKFTIKVDGKDVVLTADEMAEHVKAGMRQQDYTQKTMALAEQRKQADAEAARARTQREEYASKLGNFASQATYELNALASQLTDELLQSDPVAYLSTQRTLQARHAELQQAQQELQKINDQRQQEQSQAQAAHFQDQQTKLLAKIQEWNDPAKLNSEVAEIRKYLGTQDFGPDEQLPPDHRIVILARKAMQFDALMERARTTTKKVAAAPPKVERPGNADSARPGDGRTTAMKNLQKTGTIDAAAAAFTSFI